MKQVVVDSNILIGWYKTGSISAKDDLSATVPVFSIITKIEALGFQNITGDETKAINAMLSSGEIVTISDDIAEQTIRLRQHYKIKTPDAIIAATALVKHAELWTATTSDFSGIEGLRLCNPLEGGS